MKLVLDEHLSPAIAEELRRRGYDVVAAAEAGLRGQNDAALMEWAVANNRAVVTADYADFRTLHATYLSRREPHFGIVLIPPRFSLGEPGFGRLINAIELLLKAHTADDALKSGQSWLED